MNKELSKQICDKCGIEYEKQIYTGSILYSNGDSKPTYESIVLDFGQPENFVKLIELEFKKTGLSGLY